VNKTAASIISSVLTRNQDVVPKGAVAQDAVHCQKLVGILTKHLHGVDHSRRERRKVRDRSHFAHELEVWHQCVIVQLVGLLNVLHRMLQVLLQM